MTDFCANAHPFATLAEFIAGTTNQTKWPAIYSILGTCKLCDSSVTFPDPECDADVDAKFSDLVRAIHAETDRREREAVQESTHEQGQS